MLIGTVTASPPVGRGRGTPKKIINKGSIMWQINKSALAAVVLVCSSPSFAQSACDTQRIEAENYAAMSGIQTEGTADTGGGLNVGWIDAGDWLSYQVNLPAAGLYEVRYRVASRNGGGVLRLEGNSGQTLYGTMNVPNTGGWQNWQTLSHSVTLAAGEQSIGIGVPSGGFNINWLEFVPLDCSGPIDPPFNPPSNCASIVFEAENYDQMSGIRTQTTSDTGGGLNVGWIDAGDWLSYATVNIPSKQVYNFEYRVASPNGGSFNLQGSAGAENFDTATVPNTGGWQNWTTVAGSALLPAGNVNFGISAITGGWNINWFKATPESCDDINPPSTGITAKQAAAAMGKGFNLGQMFESTQHPRTFNAAKSKIDAYYNMGYRNVRIPITWTEAVGGNRLVADANVGAVNRNHSRLAVITQVVDYALSLPDMYVVINAHHEGGLKTNNRWWVLETLWADIADIFKDRDHRLLFEILNEPHLSDANKSPMPPANLRFMTGKAYNKIRAVDAQRIIIIGGNHWFGAGEMANVWPNLNEVGGGSDAYVMATFHHYDPWSFSGDNQGDYADAWTLSNVGNPMDIMQNWANGVGQGMPVYIGEWGVGWGSRYSAMQCNNIRYWYQLFDASYAAPKGQPTAVWDDGGWFKIFDHGTNSFNNNLAQCIGGNCAWDGADRFNSGCN